MLYFYSTLAELSCSLDQKQTYFSFWSAHESPDKAKCHVFNLFFPPFFSDGTPQET